MDETNQEKRRLTDVFKALKDENSGKNLKKSLTEQLNGEYGEYLPNLLDENSSLIEIQKAQDAINTSMTKRLALMLGQTEVVEVIKEFREEEERLQNILKNSGLTATQIAIIKDGAKSQEELAAAAAAGANKFIEVDGSLVSISGTIQQLSTLQFDQKRAVNNVTKAYEDLLTVGDDVITTQDGITGKTKKAIDPFAALKKNVAALTTELKKQIISSKVSQITVLELELATIELEQAELALKAAIQGTLEPMEAQKVAMEAIADVDMVAFTPDEDAAQVAQDLADKRISAINMVSEAEQAAFSILAQLNENKLIGIDNTERAELKALENKELSEEELAKRQLEIQTKADEQRAKILTKQAKADKLAAIFAATINTATAVTRALVTSTLFAVVVGALGAAEIAAIAAQPIPVFHEGKKPELKEGEMFAKILKSESVIPPEQSKKYKGAIDSMIDKNFESYVMKEYMLPMIKTMGKSEPEPFNDVNLWSNQKKQIGLMRESNALSKAMIRAMESSNSRRSWR